MGLKVKEINFDKKVFLVHNKGKTVRCKGMMLENSYLKLMDKIKENVEHVVKDFFDELEEELKKCKGCKAVRTWKKRRRCVLINKLYRWVVYVSCVAMKLLEELANRKMDEERVDAIVILGILGELFHGPYRNEIVVRYAAGDSMKPAIETGDIVCSLVGGQLAVEGISIEKGDVVRYILPPDYLAYMFIKEKIRTLGFLHRVVEISKRGDDFLFRFKADASNKPDPWQVPWLFLGRKLIKIIKKGTQEWKLLDKLIKEAWGHTWPIKQTSEK